MMLKQIQGLHHVTAMARDAAANNRFWTGTLGLRRVKQTVNFDEPSVYHLYYADAVGMPGTIMTCFPFPHLGRGRPGVGEVATSAFSVPVGALGFWAERLGAAGLEAIAREERFGEARLSFRGPEGDGLALVETGEDPREPWAGGGIAPAHAIRGLHSVSLRLRDAGATRELLRFMGYEPAGTRANIERLVRPDGNGSGTIDIEQVSDAPPAEPGAGSVHHVAFAVPDRAAQLEARRALLDTGCRVTPVIDRDYFFSIYFRTPGGVLFEIATMEPGFARDEDPAHLGEQLQLPVQHRHLREMLEKTLEPLEPRP